MYRSILEECHFLKTHSAIIETHNLGEIFSKNTKQKEKLKSFPIIFEGNNIGSFKTDLSEELALEESHRLAALFHGATDLTKLEYVVVLLKWVQEAQKIAPEIVDWIGIYFKASWWRNESNSDLVIGPYLGEVTEHVRISLDRGICGMALREERVVNVQDVTQNSEHIACSLKTRSELVLPLKDASGAFVAELDIDSNKLNAFSPEIEEKFTNYCLTFPQI